MRGPRGGRRGRGGRSPSPRGPPSTFRAICRRSRQLRPQPRVVVVHDPPDDLGEGTLGPAPGVGGVPGLAGDLGEERGRVEVALGAGFGNGPAAVTAVVEAVAPEDAGGGGEGDGEVGEGRFDLERRVHVSLRHRRVARRVPDRQISTESMTWKRRVMRFAAGNVVGIATPSSIIATGRARGPSRDRARPDGVPRLARPVRTAPVRGAAGPAVRRRLPPPAPGRRARPARSARSRRRGPRPAAIPAAGTPASTRS